MNFVDALAKIEGAQSVGGQLIVHRQGRNILVGKQMQGALIVENTDEARLVVAEVSAMAAVAVDSTGEPMPEPGAPTQLPTEPEPEPVQHTIQVDDSVKTSDKVSGRRGK